MVCSCGTFLLKKVTVLANFNMYTNRVFGIAKFIKVSSFQGVLSKRVPLYLLARAKANAHSISTLSLSPPYL